MRKPLLLDLFCGAGGAAAGYHNAGFDVIGIDMEPQPNYPFKMVQGDAIKFLESMWPDMFDAIHASPPCQRFSKLSSCRPGSRVNHPDLIEPTRQHLIASGLPYIIENVEGSPLKNPVTLCGTSFGLRIRRHRLFETSFDVPDLQCDHTGYVLNPHNAAGRERMFAEFGRKDPERAWREEMGVGWTKFWEGRQCVPPVYTEYIGRRLREVMGY